MKIDWNNIKSVNGLGHKIPLAMEKLFSDSPEKSYSTMIWIEYQIIHAGLLYEAAYYTIDLLIEELIKDKGFSKYYALELLFQICISESDEEILITHDKGNVEKINLTIACRRKIKSFLKAIKDIEDNYDLRSINSRNDIIEIIELWDESYSNDKYFEEE